ncbi:MAG TPA: NUDIX hydrolase [Candidatus Nanoarchaeia archaeon]|nr:NUDIX hydrolase [Candidatus Nanoarchaeia archaeon]
MKTFFVVTGIVQYENRYLLLKRSPDDYNYPNKWSFCSGFVKELEAGEETVLREIKEETGLSAEIIKTGKVMEIIDSGKRWVVACYLCNAKEKKSSSAMKIQSLSGQSLKILKNIDSYQACQEPPG